MRPGESGEDATMIVSEFRSRSAFRSHLHYHECHLGHPLHLQVVSTNET
jgi:hypothetical protein